MPTSTSRYFASPLFGSALLLAAAASAIAAQGCKDARQRAGDPDPSALSIPARQQERADPTAAAPPNRAPGADEEPSIDDEPGPVASPQPGRRAAASSPASRRRRAQGGSRPGHAAEPSNEEPSVDDPAPPADLKVTRFVVARGVSGREPVGVASSFAAPSVEKLYAFVELSNDAKAETEVWVTFSPAGGGPSHKIKLDVGPEKRWRTWALSRKPRTPGSWTATLRGAGGQVLARTSFEVTEQ